MKTILSLVTFLVALSSFAEPVPSTISSVTVFADRARVTRTADLQVNAGIVSVDLTPLPAWVDPSSLRAKLTDGEVLDVQSRREFLARTPDAEIRAAEEAVLEIEDKLAGLQDQSLALNQKREQILLARTFATRELPPEISRRDIPVEYFEKMADFVYKGTLEIDTERRRLQRESRLLQPELQARRAKLADLQQGNQLEQLIVTLIVRHQDETGGKASLSVSYELPGATWEPVHDVRVIGQQQVKLISFARVRQTTGESWENATLTFSTRSLGQSTNLPQLEAMLLGGNQRGNLSPFQNENASNWSSANDYYLGNVVVYNRKALKGQSGQALNLPANFAKQQEVQVRSAQVFRKLEGRGTTALYEAPGTQTVRTDGNPVRIPLASVEKEGELLVLAAPEVSANAARGIELVYENEVPLLPGEAGLFLDGAYIGNTQLAFTGPGETFTLFAGSEDSLKISRRMNHEESELRRGRKTNRMRVQYEITVENTGTEALPLRLADRVPVSNEQDIKVDLERVDPAVVPDEDGLLAWNVTIPPGTTKVFTLRYEVIYPANLKLQPRRQQEDLELYRYTENAPDASAAPAVESMILDLEQKF